MTFVRPSSFNASIAAASQDVNGPRPRGTCVDTRFHGSPCARLLLQDCDASRSWVAAIHHQGTPVSLSTMPMELLTVWLATSRLAVARIEATCPDFSVMPFHCLA